MHIILYVFALSSMSSMVRSIFVGFHFPFSLWVTATHFLCTAVFSFLLLAVQSHRSSTPVFVPSLSHLTRGILPPALAMALSIGCTNVGLTYANASFSEMVSSTSLLVTAALGAMYGPPLNSRLYMPLLWISIGMLIVSKGEAKFSSFGALFILVGVFFRGLKVQIQGQLLTNNTRFEDMTPLELVAWNGLTSFIIMAMCFTYLEGMKPWEFLASQGKANLYIMLFASACVACILETSSMFVLKELGPVAQQAVGQLKGVLACATATLTLGEVVRLQQACGYAVMIVAIAWYNRIDQEVKPQLEFLGEVKMGMFGIESMKFAERTRVRKA
eukprot:TRINITY_DN63106_c0_g1_i1.p1 TRINITY_DN63106_c0_g1~~TRINITY_DN63106_c0_g1_i1.p1  ORF type:complete len:360 (-),score=45.01 TRINITY_DN63106_c0_g1_i1:178-1167(-)